MLTISIDDYLLDKDATEDEFFARLDDPIFRICNLYTIKNKKGQLVPFIPNDAQLEILEEHYINGENLLAVPKARQRGISTLAAIIALDECYWNEGQQCAIVDQSQPDASKKLSKALLAYERMHPELKKDRRVVTDNKGELGFNNNGGISAGKNARGDTYQFLHVSELGSIAYEDPGRAEEIITGALPAAEAGWTIVESTHKGGRGGQFFDLVNQGLTVADEDRTKEDFKVLFFPWHDEPRYSTEGNMKQIDKDLLEYFAKKEKEISKHRGKKFKFTNGQKLWYFKTKQKQKRYMKREYPTTIEECWEGGAEGVYYATELDQAGADGRISNDVVWHQGSPVYTAWDLGKAGNQRVMCFQVIGDWINVLEVMRGDEECKLAIHWATRLKEKKYFYGGHFLPHDGEINWEAELERAELPNVIVLEKPMSIIDGINDVIDAFPRMRFNKDGTVEHRECLGLYHSKTESDGVTIQDVPVHDWTSHDADTLRVGVSAIKQGLIVDRSGMPRRANRERSTRRGGRSNVRMGHRFTNRRKR